MKFINKKIIIIFLFLLFNLFLTIPNLLNAGSIFKFNNQFALLDFSHNYLNLQSKKFQINDKSFFSQILPSGNWGPWLIRYRVYLPLDYNPNLQYGVVYFLHGRTGNRFILDSIGIQNTLNEYYKRGGNKFILTSLDGGDNYWMNAARKNERWGDVVTQEFITEIENNYSVIRTSFGRVLAGISMGGHGAIQNALNHPGTYGAIAAHSPVFRTQEEATRDFPDQFGTGNDFQDRDPFSLILNKGKKISTPLWIDIGGSDFAFTNTNNFANLIKSQNINNLELHIGEDKIGGHNTGYWQYHLLEYLNWYGKHLPSPH